MVLEGPFLNGARLPVDQILLLGCWYLPITLMPCLVLERIFYQSVILLILSSNSNTWYTALDSPDLFAKFFVLFLVLPEHVCGMVIT